MAELSDKPGIADLVNICYARGLRRVIISPGSRNAPLSISFLGHGGFDVKVIGDERVAGFLALGMSQFDQQASILVCTSGSAMLNYLPACSEAYYQRIPLLIFTADRPEEWVDQMEGQTMRQRGAMSNFVNAEFHLPQEVESGDRLHFSNRIVNEAISATTYPKAGPVHVNIPLKEPLYGKAESSPRLPKLIEPVHPRPALPESSVLDELRSELENYSKVMLIVGLDKFGSISDEIINGLHGHGIVVLNETSSNVPSDGALSWIDRSIAAIPSTEKENYLPELIITAGGPLISKRVKTLLRQEEIKAHWHVDDVEADKDLFQSLTKAIYANAASFLSALSHGLQNRSEAYADRWAALNKRVENAHDLFLESAPFSDLKAYHQVISKLPETAIVQMANSAAVRYVQLFPNRKDIQYFGNRGVSGIEGCTSTALGMSTQTDRPVILLTGDMAFRYDSNAFWNDLRPKNLKCIVFNNHGGGIFRIIPGPGATAHLETAFEAHQDNSAKAIAQLHDIKYFSASDESGLDDVIENFFSSEEVAILEIFTPRELNAGILNDYFDAMRS